MKSLRKDCLPRPLLNSTRGTIRMFAAPQVATGDLRNLEPFSREWSFDASLPNDRIVEAPGAADSIYTMPLGALYLKPHIA